MFQAIAVLPLLRQAHGWSKPRGARRGQLNAVGSPEVVTVRVDLVGYDVQCASAFILKGHYGIAVGIGFQIGPVNSGVLRVIAYYQAIVCPKSVSCCVHALDVQFIVSGNGFEPAGYRCCRPARQSISMEPASFPLAARTAAFMETSVVHWACAEQAAAMSNGVKYLFIYLGIVEMPPR